MFLNSSPFILVRWVGGGSMVGLVDKLILKLTHAPIGVGALGSAW